MEEVKNRLRTVEKVLLGDPENPKAIPGVVAELANVEREVKKTNAILERILWLILAAVITGVLSLVIKR